MSGVLLIALGACLPAFFFQAPGTDSDPVPNWDDLPVAKNRLVKTRLGEGAPAMALAEGLAVESPPLVDAGRVLGLASGRAGEVWILADTPQPSLPLSLSLQLVAAAGGAGQPPHLRPLPPAGALLD